MPCGGVAVEARRVECTRMQGMDLQRLYAGSFVDWEAVAGSWAKRTVSSRLLLFAARRYLLEADFTVEAGRVESLGATLLPDEIKRALASPPEPSEPASRRWGEFVDAAVAAELEMVSYGERPPLLHELRAGLEQAAAEAGLESGLGLWFLARRDALPGTDLPDDPGYLPV
jgi:hypothetical protein